MGKFKWSEEKIEELKREGRGQGTGRNYNPWVHIDDLSSTGNSTRAMGRKTGREHHLVSDIEFHTFLLLEYSLDVIDILEQYPISRKYTTEIASQMGIRHPTYPRTKVLTVMTYDFMVVRSGRPPGAVSCKPAGALDDPREVEKLEILRRSAEAQGITHDLIVDENLPKVMVQNLIWMQDADLQDGEVEPYPGYYDALCTQFLSSIAMKPSSQTLAWFCDQFDRRNSAKQGTGIRVAKMLLLQRRLNTDLNLRPALELPVGAFSAIGYSGLRIAGGE